MFTTNVTEYDNLTLCNCTNNDNNDNIIEIKNTIIYNNSSRFVTYLLTIVDDIYFN